MGVEVQNLAAAADALDNMSERAANLRPFLREEARRMSALIDDAWASERSPAGHPWPVRVQRTSRSRVAPRRAERGSTLRTAHRVAAGRYKLTLTVPVIYASFQFFGTSDGDVPSRNPLPFERRGRELRPVRSGSGGRFFDELRERLADYLSGGSRGR